MFGLVKFEFDCKAIRDKEAEVTKQKVKVLRMKINNKYTILNFSYNNGLIQNLESILYLQEYI